MTAEEQAALLARHVQDVREAEEGCERATLRHVIAGRCGGIEPGENRAHLRELRRQLDQIRRGVRGGGPRLLHAAAVAYAGVAAAERGEEMSEAQWQAVQRLMAGILPDWTGTDLKQRSAQQSITVGRLWEVAEGGADLLQQWKVKSAAGVGWLREREGSREWLRLIVRAWREDVERHAKRGRGLQQHRWRVRWEQDAAHAALLQTRRSRRARLRKAAVNVDEFPKFSTADVAERFCRRVRVATAYMRVTRRTRDGARRVERRRRALLSAAREERERLAVLARAREAAERRDAARREREGRESGPAARTRESSTVPERVRPPRGDGQGRRRAHRRVLTHVSARVGGMISALFGFRRRRHDPG